MTLISDEYRAWNRAQHEADKGWGGGDGAWADAVLSVAKMVRAQSILDYGAGKQTLAAALPPGFVRSYDPAIPSIDSLPDPADLVVSHYVLEHVEPECLDAVLDDMRRCTLKYVYLQVATGYPSSKTLPDGRNAHLILESVDWWLPHLMKRWGVNTVMKQPGRGFTFLGWPR